PRGFEFPPEVAAAAAADGGHLQLRPGPPERALQAALRAPTPAGGGGEVVVGNLRVPQPLSVGETEGKLGRSAPRAGKADVPALAVAPAQVGNGNAPAAFVRPRGPAHARTHGPARPRWEHQGMMQRHGPPPTRDEAPRRLDAGPE